MLGSGAGMAGVSSRRAARQPSLDRDGGVRQASGGGGGGGMRVRAPAVAGSFYPADAGELRALVTRCLAAAPAALPAEPLPKALIVPHAGYVYPGGVAAAGPPR